MKRFLAALVFLLAAQSALAQFLSPGERARDRNLSNAQSQFLTLLSPSISVSTPVVSATQTWNASGTTFTALRLTVVDASSAAGSLFQDMRVGALSKYSIDKSGNVTAAGAFNKVTLTPPASGSTLTIADGKTLTVNNTETISGTDGKFLSLGNSLSVTTNDGSLAFSNSGKVLTVANTETISGTDGKFLSLGGSLSVTTNNGSLAFGNANKVLTVDNTIAISGTDGTIWNGASSNMALAALDIADQRVTGGANVTALNQPTGSINVDCGARPLQQIFNNGAWTITAPTSDGSCLLLVINQGSAASPTFSGFTVGTGTGDTFATTTGFKFTLFIWRIAGVSGYRWAAHQ